MRRFALTMTIAGATLLATAAPLAAQGRGRGNGGVPPGHRPPPGMCRIWIDGVPPGQQPAPTDCATAVRNRPSNGRVIFGDDAGSRGRGKGHNKNSSERDNGDYDDDRRDDDRRRDDRTSSGSRTGTWGDIIRGRVPDSNTCVDNDRDGRCDATDTRSRTGTGGVWGTNPGTTSLPEMIGGVLIARGQRTADVSRWLGGGQYSARTSGVDRNGVPARVMWYDGAGQLVQIWTDRNGDGRADRVERFQNGRRVQVIGE